MTMMPGTQRVTARKRVRAISRQALRMAVGVVSCSFPAAASVYIPPIVQTEKLNSHSDCIARLEAEYLIDQGLVRPIRHAEDGSANQVTLYTESGGVRREDKNTAVYTGRLAYSFSIVRTDRQLRETSTSWTEKRQKCDGRKLVIANSQGVYLKTFEPADIIGHGRDVEPPLKTQAD